MKRVKEGEGGDAKDGESPYKKNRLGPKDTVRLFDNQILTNPLITDNIFADFPSSDLLNCSVVSKAWNMTCRGILVDRFKNYIPLTETTTATRLEDFHSLISNVVPGHQQPFNGIHVKFETQVKEWPFSSAPFDGLITRIMEKLEVKFVSLEMSNLHLKAADFRDFFKTLLIPHLGTLELLEILNFDGIGNLKTLSKQLKVDSLPNLKELNLHMSQERLKNSTFKRILRACPNLKEFAYVFPYQLPTLRSTNKLHLASKVEFYYMRLTPRDIQLLVEYSRLIKQLKMFQQDKSSKNKYDGEWISRLEPIFSSSLQFNLEFLHTELELLVAVLLQNTFPPLTSLKKFICFGSQEWFPSLYKGGNGQFARFMPNLKSLTIFWFPYNSTWLKRKYGGNENEDGPLSLYRRSTSSRLDSVRELKIEGSDRRGHEKYETLTKLMDLDEAFPCVTYLEIDFQHSGLEDLLRWICESWGDLLETLILRKTECLRLVGYADDDDDESVPYVGEDFLEAMEDKRKPLPAGVNYSDKLSHLRRLEVAFLHPVKGICEQGYEQEKTNVRTTFKPREGHEVKVLISGCRAQKRMSRVKSGVSVFETIVAIHPCPQDSELSPMEEIISTESICKKLCKMLRTEDLLSASLVNRKWNAAARKELHQSRTCTLTLNPLTFDEEGILRKLIWLASRGVELFNSLRIKTPSNGAHVSSTDVDTSCSLLEDLGLNHVCFLALEVPGLKPPYEDDEDEDPGLNEVTARLATFCRNMVRKLELDHILTLTTAIEDFDGLFRDDAGALLVRNLRHIKFLDAENLNESPEVLKRLLEELKFLKRIDSPVSSKLLPLIAAAGKAHCVKHLQLDEFPENEAGTEEIILAQGEFEDVPMTLKDPRKAVLDSLIEFLEEQQPRLESIVADKFLRANSSNEPCFRKVFQLLFNSSHETLRTLHMNLSLLQLASAVCTRPLAAVQNMNLTFDPRDVDQLLARIPFSSMVPNLKVLKLTHLVLYGLDDIPMEEPSNSAEVSLQPCVSVTSLWLKLTVQKDHSTTSSKPWNIENLALVFPRVNDFFFYGIDPRAGNSGNEFAKILGPLWKSWSSLETIKINATGMSAVAFESWLLGISEEEWSAWKELQECGGSTRDLFGTMHYAPSRYSVRNCRDFKEFLINDFVGTAIMRTTSQKSWKRLCLSAPISEEDLNGEVKIE